MGYDVPKKKQSKSNLNDYPHKVLRQTLRPSKASEQEPVEPPFGWPGVVVNARLGAFNGDFVSAGNINTPDADHLATVFQFYSSSRFFGNLYRTHPKPS